MSNPKSNFELAFSNMPHNVFDVLVELAASLQPQIKKNEMAPWKCVSEILFCVRARLRVRRSKKVLVVKKNCKRGRKDPLFRLQFCVLLGKNVLKTNKNAHFAFPKTTLCYNLNFDWDFIRDSQKFTLGTFVRPHAHSNSSQIENCSFKLVPIKKNGGTTPLYSLRHHYNYTHLQCL